MNKFIIGSLIILGIVSCSDKKPDSTKAYFSVVDYLKAQVKEMDTLPLHFTKITINDKVSDTMEITRQEFHKYAKEFLDIPDISSSKKMDDYAETNDFDEVMNNVLLMYNAKDEDDEVRSETIMMQPDESGNTHVKTILVNTITEDKDSGIEKNMTWHIDKRFQIVTKLSKPNQQEQINTVVVAWE
jgi:hypothetical protein